MSRETKKFKQYKLVNFDILILIKINHLSTFIRFLYCSLILIYISGNYRCVLATVHLECIFAAYPPGNIWCLLIHPMCKLIRKRYGCAIRCIGKRAISAASVAEAEREISYVDDIFRYSRTLTQFQAMDGAVDSSLP